MQDTLKILIVYPKRKESERLQKLIFQKFSSDEIRVVPDRKEALELTKKWNPDLVFFDPDYDLNQIDSREVIYDTAINNLESESKSFYLKLIYKIPVKASSFENYQSIKHFKRFTKIDNFSYFSKLDIQTNEDFRTVTDNLFIWKNVSNCALPLIYNFDISFFKAKERLQLTAPGLKDNFKLFLNEIDLIPLKNHAYLGFTLQGSSTNISSYLNFVSKKMFGKIHLLPTGNHSFDDVRVTLKGLTSAITKSLSSNKELDISLMSENSSGERPLMMQYLLLDQKLAKLNGDLLSGAVKLLGTFSRPNPDYPKIDPAIWQSRQALETIYADFDYGTTAVSSSHNIFNRETKPTVFLKANYLQKILSEEIKDQKKLDIIENCFTEKVRREFFRNLT